MPKETHPTSKQSTDQSLWSSIFGKYTNRSSDEVIDSPRGLSPAPFRYISKGLKKGATSAKNIPSAASKGIERAKTTASPVVARRIGQAALVGSSIKNKSETLKSTATEAAKDTYVHARESVYRSIGSVALAGETMVRFQAQVVRSSALEAIDKIDRGTRKSKETYNLAKTKVTRGIGKAALVAANPSGAFREFQARQNDKAIARAQQDWYASGPNDKPVDRMEVWSKYMMNR